MKIPLFLKVIIVVFTSSVVFYTACVNIDAAKDPESLLEAASDKSREGNFDAAIKLCNQAISLDDQNAYAYLELGNAYLQKGDIIKAIESFNQAISLDENNSSAYVGLGNAYLGKDELLIAKENYEKAISLDENNPFAYFGLGRIYSSPSVECSAKEKDNILKKLEQLDKSLANKLKEINP